MKNSLAFADKAAITLSVACAIHCLALPVVLVMLPSLAAFPLADEAFHVWMVFAVLPVSFFALGLGCKRHKSYRVMGFGIAGLVILVGAAFAGHDLLGEEGEKVLSVLGASLIALAHVFNHRLCQRNCCECPN